MNSVNEPEKACIQSMDQERGAKRKDQDRDGLSRDQDRDGLSRDQDMSCIEYGSG